MGRLSPLALHVVLHALPSLSLNHITARLARTIASIMAPTHLLLAALAASASALILPGTEKFARTVANLDITNRGYVRVDSEAPTVEHPRAAPTTISGTFRSVLAESGARGLFRGLAPSLVGIVPYAGIDLMTNSTLREYVTRRYQAAGAEPGIPELLGCGMASSTTAMLATYPLNVIRTRMQTGGMPGFPAYDTASDCLVDVVRREGVRGLYRGIAPSLSKVLPASSISYAVYDTLSAERR